MMISHLGVIENENPYYSEALTQLQDDIRAGNVRAMGIFYLRGDRIITDWVKSDGTTVLEVLGGVRILEQVIVDAMRR